jgi:molybdenum cofactor biosynthesis protein B
MVDFQSRDTRRGLTDDEDEEDEPETETADEPEEAAATEQAESDSAETESTHDHGPGVSEETLGVAVVTVSSSRTLEADRSGDLIIDAVEDAEFAVPTRDILNDDLDSIQGTVTRLADREDVDAVVTTGGTGVTPDDVTPEAVEPLFDKSLPGFGELFRALSFEEVGTKTLASRTTAGIVGGVPVFCLPGSENAVRLGIEEIVLPELEHLVGLATRE